MTPKEKAKQLIETFMMIDGIGPGQAKICATISIGEVLSVADWDHTIDFWKQVKQEIKAL